MTTMATFLSDAYAAAGGLAEVSGPRLEAVGPPGVGLADASLWIGDGAAPAGEDFLHLGHPVLEQALGFARSDGTTAARHLSVGQTRRGGLHDLVTKTIGFRNARPTFATERLEPVPIALFYFRVTWLSDEKREDIVRVAIDTLQGAPFDASALDRAFLEPGPAPEARRDGLDAAWSQARRSLETAIQPRMAVFEREAAKHLAIEMSRLDAYFDGLLRDLDRRSGAGRADAVAKKRESALADRAARRRDLEDKFRVRVSARLCCLELVDVPRILLPMRLEARRGARDLVVGYNLLTHALDPVLCDGCTHAATAVTLCREGHLCCTACSQECAGCRATACLACNAVPCSICAAPACTACDSACVDCSKTTCGRHRGACHPATPPAAHARGGPPTATPAAAAVTRPRTHGAPSARPRSSDWGDNDLLIACFADLRRRYGNIADFLRPIAVQIEKGRIIAARDVVNDFVNTVQPDATEVIERLKKVRNCLQGDRTAAISRLRKLRDEVASEARQEAASARSEQRPAANPPHGHQPGCGCKTEERDLGPRARAVMDLLATTWRRYKVPEAHLEHVRRVAKAVAPLIEAGSSRPEGWAAALSYACLRGLSQTQAGAMFGVSGATVSQRSAALSDVLTSV